MRVLTQHEAASAFGAPDIARFFGEVDWQYPEPVPSYFVPGYSDRKVILARSIANALLDRGSAILWLTEFGFWGDYEQPDVLLRYRSSFGETRGILEAPIHVFDPTDRVELVSILCIALFFNWGAEIMNADRSVAFTISHDEWLEYQGANSDR